MMKANNTLLAALGLASSFALAQSSAQMPGDQVENQLNPSAPSTEQMQSAPSNVPSSGQSSGDSDTGYQPENRPPPAPMSKPEAKEENGFTYVCGGVGDEETRQMKTEARDHDMMLTFATRRGSYLADVNVDVKDARGQNELQTTCSGPIMLIDFPKSGTYQIRAEANGYTLNKTAHVKAKGRSHSQVVLTWPQQVAEATEPVPAATSTGSSGADSSESDSSAGGNGNQDNSSDSGTR